ncbi:PQQ-dependent sugar dehydrogenase [Seonamhaeicola maritimus]|uniref:Choice-of-anchor D domain-containing protein n=1 Tax=Seonamhaeicola maritimus TaxID=2591822 RepID=A0A5C7GD55_9FLAO|nr:PQQ-dependent sugar dehydrogenase [Seonamhaeicola maritimus]TXG34495.1 choice-of-anchor D domain-containing protein [Seonamhaeicola maritimus]
MKKKLLNLLKVRYTALLCFLLFNASIYGQEITVEGNGQSITDGETTTTIDNFTDFDGNTTRTFTIDNSQISGNTTLNVSNISLENSIDFSITSNPTPVGIAKNGPNATFTITFNALSPEAFSKVTIVSDATNDGGDDFTFTISADNTPEIEMEDSGSNVISSGGNFDFGTILPNSTGSETFSIKNISNTSTTLTLEGAPNVSISGDSEFSVSSQPASNTISGGTSQTFTIEYSPTGVGGPHSATIIIDNDDQDDSEDPYTFTVTGLSANIVYTPTTDGPDWTVTNITADNELDYPYEITYGPDNFLWITERVGKNVVKVDPTGGSKTVMLDLSAKVFQSAGQDGLMGMAIHPDLYADLNTSNNFVYLAYTYDNGGRKLRIERYTYNSSTGLLDSGSATTIIEGIDASNDHNSGRLKIGPDLKLYYTIGDQGANQFSNACSEVRAQYLPTSNSDYSDYKGKVLRLNLDGSIPSDNPTLSSVQSHVYTYGHRNAQGIIFGSDGTLYSSEHGPKVDDELNIISAGKNYGWPNISGYNDNLGYEYCNWSSNGSCNPNDFSDHNCIGVTPIAENDASNSSIVANLQEPIGTYNSTTGTEPSGSWLEWPTVGPSSIDIYEAGLIPDWDKSLLISTLKRGTLFRAKLNVAGDGLESQVYEEFHSSNDRYRDIAMDPDGVTMYLITDNTGGTSGPSGTGSVSIQNPGVIIKIEYTGTVLNTNSFASNRPDFSLIPNPASNSFRIHLKSAFSSERINIQIIDIQGRIVKQFEDISQNNQITTHTLKNGLYFVKVSGLNQKSVTTKKLLIKR